MSSYDSVIRFHIGEVFYVFDPVKGIITRHIVSAISIKSSLLSPNPSPASPVIVKYRSGTMEYYSDDVYSESEIRTIANDWLLEKSISMFSEAGL